MSDTLKEIVQWFEIAKPEPTDKDRCVQIGCHYEEVSEMMVACQGEEHMGSKVMSNCAEAYKEAEDIYGTAHVLQPNNPLELLDSLCDQIVTAMGVGYMMGFDMQGALAEVSRSNMSKFEDGKAVFFENGKIAKGKDYSEPDLAKFLGERDD